MDKTNVRKNPFENQNTTKTPEPIRNTPPPNNFSDQVPRGNPLSSNPPPKQSTLNKETDQPSQNRPVSSIPSFSTNQTQVSEIENTLKEYENLKIFNSSKGFIRPTTER